MKNLILLLFNTSESLLSQKESGVTSRCVTPALRKDVTSWRDALVRCLTFSRVLQVKWPFFKKVSVFVVFGSILAIYGENCYSILIRVESSTAHHTYSTYTHVVFSTSIFKYRTHVTHMFFSWVHKLHTCFLCNAT